MVFADLTQRSAISGQRAWVSVRHLVAVLDPADIVGNLHDVYYRFEFFAANYAVLMSSSSATGRHRRYPNQRRTWGPVAHGYSGPWASCLRASKMNAIALLPRFNLRMLESRQLNFSLYQPQCSRP